MIVRISALLAGLLSISSLALAQDEENKFAPAGPFVFLMDDKVSLKPDGSYLFQHSDGDLIFEAQIAPDVRIVDNFGRALDRVFDKDTASLPTQPSGHFSSACACSTRCPIR